MGYKITKPNFMKDPKRASQYISEAFGSKLLGNLATDLEASGFKVNSINSKRMEATITTLANRGVFDMKPFFKRSAKVKHKKNGGWYLIVPISQTRRGMRDKFGGSDTVYNAMLQRLNSSQFDIGSSKTLDITDLLNKQGISDLAGNSVNQQLTSLLDYRAKSNNITAIKGSGGRNRYVAFRTVSDKSSPQSWVMNRNQATQTNTSMSLQRGIQTLINKRIKQLGGSA